MTPSKHGHGKEYWQRRCEEEKREKEYFQKALEKVNNKIIEMMEKLRKDK